MHRAQNTIPREWCGEHPPPALRENGCPRIAVTRSVPSPVAKLANHCLYTATNEFTFRIGALSSRMAQLNVVDILYAAYVNAQRVTFQNTSFG